MIGLVREMSENCVVSVDEAVLGMSLKQTSNIVPTSPLPGPHLPKKEPKESLKKVDVCSYTGSAAIAPA